MDSNRERIQKINENDFLTKIEVVASFEAAANGGKVSSQTGRVKSQF